MQKLKAQKESFFKKKACQEVLDALLIYEYEIETRDDIRKFIHFMGKKNAKRTIQKFETIRFEGHLPEVTEYFEKNPENTEKVEALEQLSSISNFFHTHKGPPMKIVFDSYLSYTSHKGLTSASRRQSNQSHLLKSERKIHQKQKSKMFKKYYKQTFNHFCNTFSKKYKYND